MIGQEQRLKKIIDILPQTQRIRNVSIVAHVDHGKTTLADCLISSNGIIHKKQAGHLKIMDDRIDQQDRGITMKSSSICLIHNDHLINLIDSPGHLQFYCQVSAALRLTDSALLVVDAVEGVSSQTFRVLQQLYDQKLPSILVVNKLDKLITHCKMDPLQAYNHIQQIVEQVNAILGSFIIKQVSVRGRVRSKSEDQSQNKILDLQSMFFFSAEKKNIVFGTALENWGFSAQSFAPLIAKKLGVEPQKIVKYLWGQFYLNQKTKQFSQNPRNQNDRPLCVDFVLKPIWDIFENVQNKNVQKIQKIIKTLNLKISQNVKKNYNQFLIKQILTNWIPLDKVVMNKIVEVLPNPIQAQQFRLPYFLQLHNYNHVISPQIAKALQICSNSPKAPFIAFISKMVNIPKGNINQKQFSQLKGEGLHRTLGFGRIFSGTISRGSQILVIGAKKKKIINENGQIIEVPDITKAQVNNLYIFNAQYPEAVKEAYAGNIVGFGNLEDFIFKSGTISSNQECISFTPLASQTKSILKVKVTTPNIEDHKKLMEGLKKLNKSDPSVDVYVQPTGDIILNTCGEVHLQKCVVDLQKIYCHIPIKTSEPIVNFRETITWTNPNENKNEKHIQELEKKKLEQLKKIQKEKYKQQMTADAQLDQQEKEKQKAIDSWDFHVQKYQSEDLTVQDTRFFFKNREDEEEDKYNYKNKDDKYKKVVDHKNRGKLYSKQKFINLQLKTNFTTLTTPNGLLSFKIRALGLQFQVAEFLQKNSQKMKNLFGKKTQKLIYQSESQIKEQRKVFLKQFAEKLEQFNVDKDLQKIIIEKMVCFTHHTGNNLTIVKQIEKHFTIFSKYGYDLLVGDNSQKCFDISPELNNLLQKYYMSHFQLLNSVILGIDLACESGPLCNQPIMGSIFIVEQIKYNQKTNIDKEEKKEQKKQEKIQKQQQNSINKQINEAKQLKEQINQIVNQEKKLQEQVSNKSNNLINDAFGPLSGQIISTVKAACLEAFIGASPRIVQPMYFCQLQTNQQYYGNIHNQLSKRRAKILQQDLHEITNVFIIKAHLPIIESFGFCFEMLDRTKGTVNAQLNFDTWKIFPDDPFYVPLTEEQIQDNGLENVISNPAKILLDKIRAKKGLTKTQKIVVAAQKQRTLKKN